MQRDRDAGVQEDAIEYALQCFLTGVGEAVAARARAACKFELQSGRAVFEIEQRLRVGLPGIGMIDPLHDLPRRADRTAGDRPGVECAPIDRLDLQPVIGFAN